MKKNYPEEKAFILDTIEEKIQQDLENWDYQEISHEQFIKKTSSWNQTYAPVPKNTTLEWTVISFQ